MDCKVIVITNQKSRSEKRLLYLIGELYLQVSERKRFSSAVSVPAVASPFVFVVVLAVTKIVCSSDFKPFSINSAMVSLNSF